jgi:hypothetical protein
MVTLRPIQFFGGFGEPGEPGSILLVQGQRQSLVDLWRGRRSLRTPRSLACPPSHAVIERLL